MTTKQLDALAKELKLTPYRRAFVECLARDPERRGSKAIREARVLLGRKPLAEHVVHVTAAMLLRDVRVKRYFAAHIEAAEARALTRTDETVAVLRENLVATTQMARGQRPTETRVYREPNGEQRMVKRYAMLDAHEKLIKHHTGEYARENQPPAPPVVVNFNLGSLTREELLALKAIRAKLVGSGSTKDVSER